MELKKYEGNVALLEPESIESPAMANGCSMRCPHCPSGICVSHTDGSPAYHTCNSCSKHWVIG